jgi:hypothetical protein
MRHPEIEILTLPEEEKTKLQNHLEKDIAFALGTGRVHKLDGVSIAEKGSRDELHLYLNEKNGGESFFHTCGKKEYHLRLHQA